MWRYEEAYQCRVLDARSEGCLRTEGVVSSLRPTQVRGDEDWRVLLRFATWRWWRHEKLFQEELGRNQVGVAELMSDEEVDRARIHTHIETLIRDWARRRQMPPGLGSASPAQWRVEGVWKEILRTWKLSWSRAKTKSGRAWAWRSWWQGCWWGQRIIAVGVLKQT